MRPYANPEKRRSSSLRVCEFDSRGPHQSFEQKFMAVLHQLVIVQEGNADDLLAKWSKRSGGRVRQGSGLLTRNGESHPEFKSQSLRRRVRGLDSQTGLKPVARESEGCSSQLLSPKIMKTVRWVSG